MDFKSTTIYELNNPFSALYTMEDAGNGKSVRSCEVDRLLVEKGTESAFIAQASKYRSFHWLSE